MKFSYKLFITTVYLACWIHSTAQQPILKQEGREKVRFDSVICYVNEYSAPPSIPALFKPEEIVMRRELNENISQDIAVIRIQVYDTGHVVLKYLKYHASLLIRGRTFKYGIIPKGLSPAWISGLRYFESRHHANDVLEVLLYGEESGPRQKVVHKVETIRVEYYDLNGKVLSQAEIQKLRLTLGSFKYGKLLRGKEAAEKYGDSKYSIGVQEIFLIKEK